MGHNNHVVVRALLVLVVDDQVPTPIAVLLRLVLASVRIDHNALDLPQIVLLGKLEPKVVVL